MVLICALSYDSPLILTKFSAHAKAIQVTALAECYDVASDVGGNFKNVGVLSIESSLFHLFHYTFFQTKHQRKGY